MPVPQPEPQRYNFEMALDLRRFCYEFQRRGERMNTAIKPPGDDHDL